MEQMLLDAKKKGIKDNVTVFGLSNWMEGDGIY